MPTVEEKQVIDLLADLDLQIMSDITEDEGSTEDEPVIVPCFYIGWPQELEAGLRGGSIGPTFLDLDSLFRWALANQDQLGGEVI